MRTTIGGDNPLCKDCGDNREGECKNKMPWNELLASGQCKVLNELAK